MPITRCVQCGDTWPENDSHYPKNTVCGPCVRQLEYEDDQESGDDQEDEQ